MRMQLIDKIRCPYCKSHLFSVENKKVNDQQLVEGQIRCDGCKQSFPIDKGILKFSINDKDLLREMAQWEVFADSEGWLGLNELYLESLPSGGSNILMKKDTIGWLSHEYNFFKMLEKVDVQNKLILDLGAGRCWSSKWISLKGGDVVAFDSLTHPTIGLGAADVFIKNHDIHFDRVSGDFNELPFMDKVFDIVFSTGSLHHSVDIRRSLNEISRVLKPGGFLVLVNEPVLSVLKREEKIKMQGVQDGINEHAYRMTKLLSLFRQNKLKLRFINESLNVYEPGSPYYQGILASIINSTKLGKILSLAIRGGVLNCIAEKIS